MAGMLFACYALLPSFQTKNGMNAILWVDKKTGQVGDVCMAANVYPDCPIYMRMPPYFDLVFQGRFGETTALVRHAETWKFYAQDAFPVWILDAAGRLCRAGNLAI
jgi:hypothetical protein